MLPVGADQVPIPKSDLTLDLRRRGLYRASERIRLSPKPFDVLLVLFENRGRILSKREILATVWGEHHEENIVEQAVRQIRRALGDEVENPRFIQTFPGQGYCFAADAATSEPAPTNTDPPGSEPSAKSLYLKTG